MRWTQGRITATVTHMARGPRSRGGRPDKGDRRQLASRMPVAVADAIEARADALGMYVSDYVAAVLAAHVGLPAADLTLPSEQETQPMETLPIESA